MHPLRFYAAFTATLLTAPALVGASIHDPATAHPDGAKVSPYSKRGHSRQAELYYGSVWGIERLRVQRTASGALIRFSYRVLDAKKAQAIQAKKAEPHLLGQRSHALLSVPTLENVGQLRQTESIAEGKDYWVLFSNRGDLVKLGDRVDVIIGDFYANSLTVE